MSLEDPYFAVKKEISASLSKNRNLFERWKQLQSPSSTIVAKDELDWTANEIKNGIRSIEWDIDDLEETVQVLEANPRKFKIDESAIAERKQFISECKNEVNAIKTAFIDSSKNPTPFHKLSPSHRPPSKSLIPASMELFGSNRSSAGYTSLRNDSDLSPTRAAGDYQQQQQTLFRQQDDELDAIHTSVGTLKVMSKQIGNELEDQSVMLDDLGREMDHTESRLDNTLRKMARVLNMSNDRRQWTAIFILSGLLLVIIILFFILP